jgi:ribosomal protein S24E
MEHKIISQQKNPFLQREEIIIEIKDKTTPSAEQIKSALGKDPNLTIVKKINAAFGSQTFTAEIVIYDNQEAKKRIETIPKKVRKKIEADEKAKKEAEKKAKIEAAKKSEESENKETETKPEEPKEEPKPEETKEEAPSQ